MNKVILRRIILCGLFLIPFTPFLVSGSLFFPFITTKAFAWRIIVEIILAAWLLLILVAPEYRPKRSKLLWAVGMFILIVGLADLLGVAPVKSFWSNFERMEGYVLTLHLGALFLIMGSIFKEREWKWWWNTSLVASLIMVFYCVLQLLKVYDIHQGGVRVDGTIGNAAYLALYLLFHIFVALYYFVKSRTSGLRWAYGLLIFCQIVILYYTATRGAILGLLGGLFLIALINIRNKDNPKVRTWSRYLLGCLVALVALFFLLKNTSFVQNNPVLSRFSSISLSEFKTEGRAFIWPMALKGIAERPLLGWGQDNFNYVFAEHYSAQMYSLEPWFDRAHNIFLDWGVSAGVLGLGAYLALYVLLLIAIWRKENSMPFLERSILTGLIAAYFFNNFFIFDNLISYTLFFALIAHIHSRDIPQTAENKNKKEKDVSEDNVLIASIPIVIAAIVVIYVINIRPIIANSDLIAALQISQSSGSKEAAIGYFEKAYNEARLGRPEVVEWISSDASAVLGDNTISLEERNAYFTFAKNAVEGMTQNLKGDPRYELVAANFYSSIGQFDDAIRHLNLAMKYMPEKQVIYFQLGQIYLTEGKADLALSTLKTAYDLAPNYEEAQIDYLVGAIFAKNTALINQIIASMNPDVLIGDNRPFSALFQTGQKSLLISILQNLKTKLPDKQTEIDSLIKQAQS